MAIVRKELSMGVPAAEARPERDLETTPVFSGLTKKCLDARPLIKARPGMPEMDKGSMV